MMSPSPTQADLLVAEMGYLFGARFEISNSGPNGEPRWHYETSPGLRNAARSFLKGVDRHQYGYDDGMVAAITRLKGGRS